MKMVKCYRKTVSLSDLWVTSHEKLSDFYVSSWQQGESPIPLLMIRTVLAAVAVGILAWSLVEGWNLYWLLFLTNWGLVLVVMMMLSGTYVSISALHHRPTDCEELPWFVSMYWFFSNIAVSIALMITALYWILLYDPHPEVFHPRMFWLEVVTHGFNSCLVVCEVLFSRTPVRILHVYQPLGFGLWYAVFSAIYYAAGGTDGVGNPFIYEVLDWRHGRRTGVVVAGATAGLIIIYTVLWGVALCRDKISAAIIRTTSHDLTLTPSNLQIPARIV